MTKIKPGFYNLFAGTSNSARNAIVGCKNIPLFFLIYKNIGQDDAVADIFYF